MKYTVYKTTNILNNKTYIGMHKTIHPEDDYLGSGIAIRRAVKKYGRINFRKEILFVFDNAEEAFLKEKELVTLNSESYNLKEGGCGGFDHLTEDQRKRDPNHMKMMNRVHMSRRRSDSLYDERWRAQVRLGLKRFRDNNPDFNPQAGREHGSFKGRQHSDVTKQKISNTMKQFCGSKNSGFNKIFICKGTSNKRVKREELESFINDGWILGRVMRNSH